MFNGGQYPGSILSTTRKVDYPKSGLAHFSAAPENRIIWQTISLANRRLTGCWKSKINGGEVRFAQLIHSNRQNHETYSERCFPAPRLYRLSHTLNLSR